MSSSVVVVPAAQTPAPGGVPVVVPPADLDAEWASLEAEDLAGEDDLALGRVSEAVGAAFAEVRRHARRQNLVTARPEVVLVGTAGAGKSALLDAVVGVPGVGSAQPTQRPLVVHTAWAPAPRAVFRRDLSLREYDRDEVLSEGSEEMGTAIAAAVAARNVAAAATEAMVLELESPRMLDATYIDTPGLIADAKHPLAAAHEAATLSAIAPASRLIVVVRPAACAALPRTASLDPALDVVRRVDPEYTRTVVVYTQLHAQLAAFQSAKAVNQYLTVTAPDVRTFFVTLPALELRARIGADPAAYDALLRKAARRDRRALEQLQYDKRHEAAVGAPALVQHVAQHVRRAHQAFSPRVLQAVRAHKAAAERARTAAARTADALTPPHFRAVAADCTTRFLQQVRALLRGAPEGCPAVNGETLDQEKAACGIDGQWVTANGEPLPFHYDDDSSESDSDSEGGKGKHGDSVPLWDNRLYGTQQFERLLAEFRVVGEHLRIPPVSDDDIATAAGIPALAGTPNTLWAASDIARQKSQDTFVPLVAQLARRAEHVLCRLADIAESLMDERARRTGDEDDENEDECSITTAADRTSFVTFVKDRYRAFVEDASVRCQQACMHEFYSSRTVHWDLTENSDSAPVAPGSPSEVRDLAARIFETLKQCIVSNVIVRFYQLLLVPLDTQLWAAMQKQVSELPDNTLEQLFSADTLRRRCASKAESLAATAAELADEETAFIKVAHNFAHLE